MVPARNMSWATSASGGAAPPWAGSEHERHDDAARDDVGQEVPDGARERVEGHPHRVLEDDRASRSGHGLAPSPRSGLRSSSRRLARMMRMSWAVPARARMVAGSGRCLIRSQTLAQLQRRLSHLVGKETADVHVEEREAEVHEHEGQHEGRHGQADEADEGGDVVARPSTGGRPSRCRWAARATQVSRMAATDTDHGEPEPVADHLGHGPAPLEGHAELPPHHHPHPAHVLDPDGLVEPVLLAEGFGLLLGHEAARGRHLRDIGA